MAGIESPTTRRIQEIGSLTPKVSATPEVKAKFRESVPLSINTVAGDTKTPTDPKQNEGPQGWVEKAKSLPGNSQINLIDGWQRNLCMALLKQRAPLK